ncbi:hypothetical protein [Oceanobacillus sp. Castelsardo]|uniref:hypothetical protein n=1 Tax=Oceanobacillus sp. Castelsardo TaxID=1851204 RepID=UPI0008388866|nr:hypothetical protein [Oceanobacillus sp. Castelsardo]
MQYEAREKALKDIASIQGDALEEGIEKGIEQEKKVMALKMLKKNMELDLITELTVLSKTELMELKKQC